MEGSFWFLSRKIWGYFFLIIQLGLIMLILGGLGTKYWVQQGKGQTKWDGGLLRYNDGVDNWQGQHYDQISDQICQLSDQVSKGLCSVFQDLQDAGIAFILLEMIFLLTNLVWFVLGVYRVVGKPFKRKLIQISILGVGYLAHIIGISVWGGVAKSGFDADCQKLHQGGDRTELCSLDGPAIAVTLCVIFPLFAVLYYFVFKNQQHFKENPQV